MRLFNKLVVSLAMSAFLFLGTGVSFGASIVAAGADSTTQANWRTTTTAKPLDIDGNNVYGSLGYDALNTSADTSTNSGTLVSLPSWLNVTINGVNASFAAGYPSIDDPTLAPGASVADVHTGISYRNTGGTTATLYDFNFGAGTPVGMALRVGVIQNGAMSNEISYTLTQGANSATQVINSVLNDGVVRYAFFDVTNAVSGDVITVSGTIAGAGNNGLSGFSFDSVVPEPASMSLLAVGGLVLIRRRRR